MNGGNITLVLVLLAATLICGYKACQLDSELDECRIRLQSVESERDNLGQVNQRLVGDLSRLNDTVQRKEQRLELLNRRGNVIYSVHADVEVDIRCITGSFCDEANASTRGGLYTLLALSEDQSEGMIFTNPEGHFQISSMDNGAHRMFLRFIPMNEVEFFGKQIDVLSRIQGVRPAFARVLREVGVEEVQPGVLQRFTLYINDVQVADLVNLNVEVATCQEDGASYSLAEVFAQVASRYTRGIEQQR